jgi:hypothetical protein
LSLRSKWEALTQAGHAYCVWETDGNIHGYDRNSGSFPLPVYIRDARAIAIVLAQDLSKVLKEPLSVANAEFIEPNQTSHKSSSERDSYLAVAADSSRLGRASAAH